MSVPQRAPHLGPERRRPLILDAALGIAVRDGIGAVTVGSLAHEMGVTRSVVYAAFRDRLDVLTTLLAREAKVLTDDVLGALHGVGPTDDPEEAFVEGFVALLWAALARSASWRLVLLGEPDQAMSDHMRAAKAVVTRDAAAWIRPALERWWQIQDLDRKLPVLIDLFMGACQTAIVALLDEEQGWSADDLGRLVGRSVCGLFERA